MIDRHSFSLLVGITSLCLLLAVTAVSYHHHDTSFQLPTCSICKVKISLSGGFSKSGADAVVPGAGPTGPAARLRSGQTGRAITDRSIVMAFQPPHPHSNKAPPAQS
jgi:hypothetical protein